MLLYYTVIVFITLDYLAVPVISFIDCQDNAELYFQKGQLVQIKRNISFPGRIQIVACKDDNAKPMELDPEQLLRGISILVLHDVAWPSLHVTSMLEQVDMYYVTSMGVWGDCSRLVQIKIKQGTTRNKHNVLATVPPDWLSNCTQLRSLHLVDVRMMDIRKLLESAPNITSLVTSHIIDFFHITQYSFIPSSRNHIIHSISIGLDSHETDPVNENVTWTEMSASLMWQLSLLPLLDDLYIYGNDFDMCAVGNLPPVQFRSLKYLQLHNTNTPRFCLRHYYQAPQLHTILLNFNSQARSPGFKIQFRELFSTRAPQLFVNFYNHGQVLNFDFTRDDYLSLYDFGDKESKKANVQLLGFKQLIKCECNGPSLWFFRALRAGLVTAPGVLCTNFITPAEIKCDWIDCDRINCNSTCVCCREEQDAIRADCRHANITSLPTELLRLQNLTRLIAPNENIVALPDHLPGTLLGLDLTGNNIWNAGAGEVGSLFTQPKRRVRLARNYILCSCENMQLITQLQNYKHQIEDFNSITCAITNTELKNVDVSQLCAARDRDKALIKQRETTLIAVLVSLVVAVACLVVAFILHQRRRELQIFLFARGWCLCCITEEELDAHRYYDVFVSFCHADTAFVLEHLLPPLDCDYSVCVHLRDWVPGEMIPSQITKSVEQSRRTLVVMSRNFVRSEWGRLEFQTAHVNGLADGRVRVIMIILDDVLEKEQLAPELRSYVRLNTYVRWGDPWFWEKLRYALPHHPTPRAPPMRLQIEYGSRDPIIEMRRIEGLAQHHSERTDTEHYGIVHEVE